MATEHLQKGIRFNSVFSLLTRALQEELDRLEANVSQLDVRNESGTSNKEGIYSNVILLETTAE